MDKKTGVIDGFDIHSIVGLSEDEAALRLKRDGYNELPASKRRGIFNIVFEVFREPMFLLLIAGGTIYLVIGDTQEALMLLGFVFVVINITIYQERKTEHALEALRDLSSPRALLIRNREHKRIPGREVVRGDTIILSEGDRVVADSVLIYCISLSVDESLLTGESIPVTKITGREDMEMSRPGGDAQPFVYSGTLVVKGFGVAVVKKAGADTEMGLIGNALLSIEYEQTILQREMGRIVRTIAVIGLSLCVIVAVVHGAMQKDWLNGLLAGITLAMAILPEEFPVVFTIFLAIGAWRMSKKNVLTRRVTSVETLGAASVLCVDKTGTITLNRMTVSKIIVDGHVYDIGDTAFPIEETLHEVLEFGILASQMAPFDPMEKAISDIGLNKLSGTEHIHSNWTLVQEYPLSENLLAMSRVYKSPDNDSFIIAAKGAPEAIADICHLDKEQQLQLSRNIDLMARDGLRVIGVAKSEFEESSLPQEQHDFRFQFLGLIGLSDPVRNGVKDAIKECYDAGIRVVMITGDYSITAQKIAQQIGLASSDQIITGEQLSSLNDLELQNRIKTVNIFARVVPEQKLRIINALKANGEVVAMTGDGVNDAPALKSAHIGIAMGGRGTDVAREASDIVLLDDDFSSIVQAVRMGRRIFANLKKAISYIIAIHVPIAGISLLPVFFNWNLILLPVHIVFLELIIDPACSIVFEVEPEEADVMNKPPRQLKEPLFNKATLTYSIMQGFVVLLVVMMVYTAARYLNFGETDARTLGFTTLIVANMCLILTNRSWSQTILSTLNCKNSALWWILSGTVLFLGLVLYVPVLRELFHFCTLHVGDLVVCLALGIISILWFEGVKVVKKNRNRYAAPHHP
ncbi:MAG: HAD-IC family P-type ATPase [Nitrospirae bacterium]|nr:HAD-IC family P-type ATPase [Nitrospirota bacterium]